MSAPTPSSPPLAPGGDGGAEAPFPGALAALLITLAALVATAFVAALLDFGSATAAVGIGEAIGLGGVASLAARRVPEPQALRLGLQGFSPRLLPTLLSLLPGVILLSELDNCLRAFLPPSPELQQIVNDALTRTDSIYDSLLLAIVLIGIAPLVESFLFFGVLLQGLIGHLGLRRGVLLVALLYTLVHAPQVPAASDASVPLIAAMTTGTLLALVRLASGSILASAVLAAAYAAVHLPAPPAAPRLPLAGLNPPRAPTSSGVLIVPVASVVWGARRLLRAGVAAPTSAAHDADASTGG